MKLFSILLMAIALYCTNTAHAQKCSDKCSVIDQRKITIKGIELAKSKIEDVFKIFGPAQIYSPYENRPSYICYTSNINDDKTALVFSSYASNILTVEIYKYKTQILPMLNCTISDLINEEIGFDSGLKLNLKHKEFKKMKYNVLFDGLDDFYSYECCIDKKNCNANLELHLETKLLKDKIYYIKKTYTNYCQ